MISCLIADKRERECAEYTADCMGAILKRFFRYSGADDFEFPIFTELYSEQEKEPEVNTEGVKDHLLALLTPSG